MMTYMVFSKEEKTHATNRIAQHLITYKQNVENLSTTTISKHFVTVNFYQCITFQKSTPIYLNFFNHFHYSHTRITMLPFLFVEE